MEGTAKVVETDHIVYIIFGLETNLITTYLIMQALSSRLKRLLKVLEFEQVPA